MATGEVCDGRALERRRNGGEASRNAVRSLNDQGIRGERKRRRRDGIVQRERHARCRKRSHPDAANGNEEQCVTRNISFDRSALRSVRRAMRLDRPPLANPTRPIERAQRSAALVAPLVNPFVPH
ncbi:MAG TPA: hypothetical protein DCQ98_11690 [Planctomycetaceae bacterium]|nr:hypothetical protein [Planctomycetaceae bacterium]